MENFLVNKYFKEAFFHFAILFLISISAFLKINNYFDLLLIASLIIFTRNKSIIFLYYPLTLFTWGIYSDVLIGYPFGYSGAIFLFFFTFKATLRNFCRFRKYQCQILYICIRAYRFIVM